MTDYAAPTTPAAALEQAAQAIRYEAAAHRKEALHRSRMGEECERIADYLDGEASRYARYQPTLSAE